MSIRNNRKRGVIDIRDSIGARQSESERGFKITLRISQLNRETQTFAMRQAAMAKSCTEKQRTYWPRFVEAVHIPVGGRREIEIEGMDGAVLTIHHWRTGLPSFEFNGLLDALDADVHDEIRMEFRLDSGKITTVVLTLIPASDKEFTRELEEMLARSRADYDLEVGWDNFAWVVRRAFAASKFLAVQGHTPHVQIDFGPATSFYVDAVWVDWQWVSPDEIHLSIGCSPTSSRSPGDADCHLLESLGWTVSWGSDRAEGPTLVQFVNDPNPRTVISAIVASIRHAYSVQPTDDVLVRPKEIAVLIASTSRETASNSKFEDGQFTLDSIKQLRSK